MSTASWGATPLDWVNPELENCICEVLSKDTESELRLGKVSRSCISVSRWDYCWARKDSLKIGRSSRSGWMRANISLDGREDVWFVQVYRGSWSETRKSRGDQAGKTLCPGVIRTFVNIAANSNACPTCRNRHFRCDSDAINDPGDEHQPGAVPKPTSRKFKQQ